MAGDFGLIVSCISSVSVALGFIYSFSDLFLFLHRPECLIHINFKCYELTCVPTKDIVRPTLRISLNGTIFGNMVFAHVTKIDDHTGLGGH